MKYFLFFSPSEEFPQERPDWEKVRTVVLAADDENTRTIDSEDVRGNGLEAVRGAAARLLQRYPAHIDKIRTEGLDIRYADVFADSPAWPAVGSTVTYRAEDDFSWMQGRITIECCNVVRERETGTQAVGSISFKRINALKEILTGEPHAMHQIQRSRRDLSECLGAMLETSPNRQGRLPSYTGLFRDTFARDFGVPVVAAGDIGVMVASIHPGGSTVYRGLPIRSWGLHRLAMMAAGTFRGFVVQREDKTKMISASDGAKELRGLSLESGPLPKWQVMSGVPGAFISYWDQQNLNRRTIAQSMQTKVYRPQSAGRGDASQEGGRTKAPDGAHER